MYCLPRRKPIVPPRSLRPSRYAYITSTAPAWRPGTKSLVCEGSKLAELRPKSAPYRRRARSATSGACASFVGAFVRLYALIPRVASSRCRDKTTCPVGDRTSYICAAPSLVTSASVALALPSPSGVTMTRTHAKHVDLADDRCEVADVFAACTALAAARFGSSLTSTPSPSRGGRGYAQSRWLHTDHTVGE